MSLFVILVAFYNLLTSKLYSDKTKWEKIEKYIDGNLPEFVSRFFVDKRNELTEDTLYTYAAELASFFSYIEDIKHTSIDTMNISTLEAISEANIEDYMGYRCTINKNNEIRTRSLSSLCHQFAALRSFFEYFYVEGLINVQPTRRLTPPVGVRKPKEIASKDTVSELVSFILNGNFDNQRSVLYQNKVRERDAAITALLACSGLKISEVVNLNIDDLHLDEHYVILRNRSLSKVILSKFVVKTISEYLRIRLSIITEYGHENALFISLKYKRIAIRSIQDMLKRYTTALFDENTKISSQDLRNFYIDNIYNTVQSLTATASLCGTLDTTIYDIYKADLIERHTNTLISL